MTAMSSAAGSEDRTRPGAARSRILIGLTVGLAVAAGATWAVLAAQPDDTGGEVGQGSEATGAPEGVGEETTVPADGEPLELATEWPHTFSEDHEGSVWITVTAPDTEVRSVTIAWGPWERHLEHTAAGPASYHFSKGAGPTVTTTVRVEPAANVTFHEGAPPEDAIDVNDDWQRVEDQG